MVEKINLEKKSVARLIACQALCMYYDENNYDKDVDNILNAINENYVKVELSQNNDSYSKIYKHKFVKDLINGTIENVKKYDALINKLLDKQNTTETIDEILLNVFRLSSCEFENYDTNKNVIIKEYTDIVAEFYNNIYINFANGIMENLATKIREAGELKEGDGTKKEENTDKNKVVEEKNSDKSGIIKEIINFKGDKLKDGIRKDKRKIITLKKK